MRFKTCVVCLLSGSLVFPGFAQQVSGPANKLVDQKGALTITVLEGEGAKNSVRARTATAPAVEVKDASGKAVSGAEVVFQLPAVGPSGTFNGWLKTQTVRTDEQGKAGASGYTPNSEAGRFNIKVTATLGTQSGSVVIAQSNVEGDNGKGVGAKKSGTWKYIAGIGGAAVALGVVAATRGGNGTNGSSPASAVPVSVTPGSITVAGPR